MIGRFIPVLVFSLLIYLGAPHGSSTQDIPVTVPHTVLPISETSSEHHALVPGDNVRVELDVEVFKIMQEGHGDLDDHLLSVSFLISST